MQAFPVSKHKVFSDQEGNIIVRTGPGQYVHVGRSNMNQDPQHILDQSLLTLLATQKATPAEVDLAADISARVQELTVTGNVNVGVREVELNHISAIIAAAMVAPRNCLVIIKNTSASGTAAHTFTVSAGTLDGSNTIATLDAPGECLFVYFDSNGDGVVIENVGTIVLS